MNETGTDAGRTQGRRISVFLLDDHEVVRRGLRDLLEAEPDVDVIGEAGTAASAAGRILALQRMWPCSTCACRMATACRSAVRSAPRCRTACLMLTSYGDDGALLGAIMAGAAGYVLKETCGSDLVSAVRTVAAGRSTLDADATKRVMERLRDQVAAVSPLSALTGQEKRVLELIGRA